MKTSFRRLAYNIFFRFSPILFVVLLELALRLFGVGESYLLFNESANGKNYELNPIYYRRFVSAEQYPNIDLLPQSIPIEKPDNSYRIFLIGDQTLCSTFPEINKKAILQDFSDRTGKQYDIVQLAVPLTNSFAVKRLVQCVNRYKADACVIVTGGNEIYGIPRKSAWMQDIDNFRGLGLYVTMKNHRFVQTLERFIYVKKTPQTVFPPENLDEWVVEYNSESYLKAGNYFDRNLKKIAKRSKCPIFMVSVPSNIKYVPYRSLFADKELNDAELAKECAILVANADPFTIDRWIDDLESWEPQSAIFYYCKAMIEENEGRIEEALDYYNKALELDAFRVRFDRDMYLNIVKYETAAQINHIDLYKICNESSQNGRYINQYFTDGIALNKKGEELFKSQVKSALIDYFNQ